MPLQAPERSTYQAILTIMPTNDVGSYAVHKNTAEKRLDVNLTLTFLAASLQRSNDAGTPYARNKGDKPHV